MTGALLLLFLAGVLAGVVALFRCQARYDRRWHDAQQEPDLEPGAGAQEPDELSCRREIKRREAERNEGQIDVPSEWRIDGDG